MTELTRDEWDALQAALDAPNGKPPASDEEMSRRATASAERLRSFRWEAGPVPIPIPPGKATSLGAAIYSLGLYMDGCRCHRSLGYNGEAIVLGMDRNTPRATLRQIPNVVNGWPVRAFDSDNVVVGHTPWLKIGADV